MPWIESRRNRLVNPNFGASSHTGWGLYFSPNRTFDATDPFPGGNGVSARYDRGTDARANLGCNATGTGLSGVPGRRHAIVRIKAPVGVNLNIGFRTGLGLAQFGVGVVAGDGTWKEYSYYTDSSVANGIQINVPNSDVIAEGSPLFWLDSALLEFNSDGAYMDGEKADTATRQWSWLGAANNSMSTEEVLVGEQRGLSDLENDYLGTLGATGDLSSRRLQVYGENEFAYFAARSDLSTANSYSLADHEYAYYLRRSNRVDGSLADVSRAFWQGQLG